MRCKSVIQMLLFFVYVCIMSKLVFMFQAPFVYGLKYAPWGLDVVTIGGFSAILYWFSVVFMVVCLFGGLIKRDLSMFKGSYIFYFVSCSIFSLVLFRCSIPVDSFQALLVFLSALFMLGISVWSFVDIKAILVVFGCIVMSQSDAYAWGNSYKNGNTYETNSYSFKSFKEYAQASMPSVIKNDFIKLLSTFKIKCDEVKPGFWSQRFDKDAFFDMGSGVELNIKAGTELNVQYVAEDTYKVNTTKPINIQWGCEVMSSDFSMLKLNFGYDKMHLTVEDSDLKQPLSSILGRKDGWDIYF